MTTNRLATIAGVLALAITPAAALASGKPTDPGSQGRANKPATSGTQSKAQAYGKYCQNQSKKHVAGQKGTPFSQCVVAMAHAANGTSPTQSCKALSKKHVAGQKGTPFSKCVTAAAKLQSDKAAS
jgi:hypothetical protein